MVGAIIPAAGRGERLGRRDAKAFVPIAGVPLIIHTLRAFEAARSVRRVVVAVRASDRGRMRQLLRRWRIRKVGAVVEGGVSRSASVARGLAVLPPALRLVVVHDAARCCVTPRLIDAAVAAARRHGAVVTGEPAHATVKAVDEQAAVRLTLDRHALWFAQTPQVFRRDWFVDALARAGADLSQFPDDAAILEWAGYPVRMIAGDSLNIKVTTPGDLILAETILKVRNAECGMRNKTISLRTPNSALRTV